MPTYWKHEQLANVRRKPAKRSMKALFLAIWAERPHVCEICGSALRYVDPPASCFPHRLNKRTWGRFRYCRPNVALTCPEHHERIDAQRGTRLAEIVASCKKWLLEHPEDEWK